MTRMTGSGRGMFTGARRGRVPPPMRPGWRRTRTAASEPPRPCSTGGRSRSASTGGQ